MLTVDPTTFDRLRFNSLLTGAVIPRPIAFASTIDRQGQINLSPFSFFNVFSYNPPVLVFSISTRMRDLPPKNTLENVLEVPEVVINIVTYDMVEQMSLTSTEYEKGVNEFVKGGFTATPSQRVRPPRVQESPVAFECTVRQVLPLAENGGAGNLVICDVILAHFAESLFDDLGHIDPARLDAVARLGNNWYCRVDGPSIFEIPKPLGRRSMGVDQLPAPIRNSTILTGNNLGRLATMESLPDQAQLQNLRADETVQKLLAMKSPEVDWHRYAREVLMAGDTRKALGILLLSMQES